MESSFIYYYAIVSEVYALFHLDPTTTCSFIMSKDKSVNELNALIYLIILSFVSVSLFIILIYVTIASSFNSCQLIQLN